MTSDAPGIGSNAATLARSQARSDKVEAVRTDASVAIGIGRSRVTGARCIGPRGTSTDQGDGTGDEDPLNDHFSFPMMSCFVRIP